MLQSLHASLTAVRSRYRSDGARGVADHLLVRSRAQIYERERHLVVVKDLRDIKVPARRGRLELEVIDRSHLDALSALNRERGDLTGDVRFGGDLSDGYRGFVARRVGALVGFYWWADATMPPHREHASVALGVRLGQADVYGTDFYITPAHRGQGVSAEFLYLVESALRELGFEWLWGTVAEDNRAARWLYDTRGYQSRWAVDGVRTLRRWHYRMTPLGAPAAS